MPTTWTTSRPTPVRRHSQEEDVYVFQSSSSDLSSGDEDVYHSDSANRVRPIHQWRTASEHVIDKIDDTRTSGAYRHCTHPRPTERQSRFRRQSGVVNHSISQSSRPEEPDEVFVTTMDEDDQQLFIALFFWRRKVIQAHFSAWKWVILSLRRSAKQLRRQRINTRKVATCDHEFIGLYSRRPNLILKRNTGHVSAEDKTQTGIGYDKTMASRGQRPHEMKQKAIMAKSPITPDKASSKDARSSEKRRQFRAELRLVYSCFNQWKGHLDESKKRMAHLLAVATAFRCRQQLTIALAAWRFSSRLRKQKRKRLHIADQFHWNFTKYTFFSNWKHHCRVEREIIRRQNVQVIRLKLHIFQRWCTCIIKTQQCREFSAKQRCNQLQITFRRFCQGVLNGRRERWQSVVATSHYQQNLQRSIFRTWRKAVFESASYLQSLERGKRISLSVGTRKWKEFIVERQRHAEKYLLADYFRYRVSLRRAVIRWGRFLLWKRQCKQVIDEAQNHFEKKLKTFALRKLRSAGYSHRVHRSQVRMATQWHKQNLLTRLLELWIANAQHCARLRQFQHAIDTRKQSSTICIWREQMTSSKLLASKQHVVLTRWNELLLKTYMDKWVRMLHIRAFISSLKLKRHHTSISCHFRAWHGWSSKRVSWHNTVQHHRLQRDEALLQRVVSQWFGVTLRKRCFQRLVKLFRKKQTRQRLKSMFKLLRVHALNSKKIRKLNRELIHSSIVIWKCACRESKEKRIALVMATRYYTFRRYAMALKRWSFLADKRAQIRLANGKALAHYFRKILGISLQCWYVVTRKRHRQREFFRQRRQLREEQTKTRVLYAWYMFIKQRAQRRAEKWAALQFQVEHLQRRSFYAWQEFLKARRLRKESEFLATTTYVDSMTCKVLRAWNRSATRLAQCKLKCLYMRSAISRRRLQTSITRWSTFRHNLRHHREQRKAAKKFYNEYLLCLVMFSWQDIWFKTSVMRDKEKAATRQIVDRRLAKALSRWNDYHHEGIRIRAKKAKALRFYMAGVLAKCLKAWQNYHAAARHKTIKRRNAEWQNQKKVLTHVFKVWQFLSEEKSFKRWRHKYAKQHRIAVVLGLVFQGWRRYRNKHTLQNSAELQHNNVLLRKIWLAWKSYRVYAAKVKRNVLVTNQLLRHKLSHATFARWKKYAFICQELHAQLVRADDHHAKWLCKRAVTRLRKEVLFRQAAVQAQTISGVNTAKKHYSRWKHFVALMRTQRSRHVLAERIDLQNRQKRHFLGWKRFTKRCVSERQSKSDALYRVAIIRMVWSRWHRVIGWRKCIATMNRKQLEYLQLNTWRRWRSYTRKHIELKVKTVKALSFLRKQVRTTIWRSWFEFLRYRREKQQQLVWVLSYYSVEVLQRQFLLAWKKFVGIQQAKREKKQLAELFNVHRLVRESYYPWKAYVELRKMNLVRTEAEQLQVKKLVLSRSVRKWRKQTSIWCRQHHSVALAASVFCRRRLQHGLERLLAWKVVKRDFCALRTQAERFKNDKAVVSCFRCWQRYHQWRKRYGHLTRVFKQSRKQDVFGRWKVYWEKRQLTNERRLQARVFHCVHTEQRVVGTWKTFVLLHKHKKKARAYDKSRTLHRTFTHWKRKVHVLRQMRKMFVYQESCCVQTHFGAWKRYVFNRKLLDERVRGAMKFKDRLRKKDVWQKWCVWVCLKQQERETIALAEGFRQRFFTRKSFVLWRKRALGWKRKRVLSGRALHILQETRLRRCFLALADRRQTRIELNQRQNKLNAQLIEKRMRRAIGALRCLRARRQRQKDLLRHAFRHWELCHQRKYWSYVLRWHIVAKHRKLQRLQAMAFSRVHTLKRCFDDLKAHTCQVKQIQGKIEAFRHRYFRSVADDCFYQWRSFTGFKLKLCAFARRTRQSQRRQRLLQWRRITVDQARLRDGMQSIAAKRRRRELVAWFNHWESVCTDQWLEKELVTHHRRHAQQQRLLVSAVKTWKLQLAIRRERRQWRLFFLNKHRAWLRQVLQHWQSSSTTRSTSTCDV